MRYGLNVRLNLVTRDSLETGEEPVHVRMREEVGRRRRRDTRSDTSQVSRGAVGWRWRCGLRHCRGHGTDEHRTSDRAGSHRASYRTSGSTGREQHGQAPSSERGRGRNHGRLPTSKANQNVCGLSCVAANESRERLKTQLNTPTSEGCASAQARAGLRSQRREAPRCPAKPVMPPPVASVTRRLASRQSAR